MSEFPQRQFQAEVAHVVPTTRPDNLPARWRARAMM
jgi:hypothetical protein